MLPNIKKFVKRFRPRRSLSAEDSDGQSARTLESSGATGETPARPKCADWRLAAVFLLAACFFVGTSSYNYLGQSDNFIKWSSPDETANYYFAKLYAEKGELSFFENLNLYAGDIIHPRSMRSDAGEVKPTSFLGIILIFGTIAKITSVKVLPYLTPFFGAIGIVFFYLLIKQIFGRKNAFISAFFLASFPPFIYYSARSMFHNVLFAVLMIIGLYFIFLIIKIPPAPFSKGGVNWRGFLYTALAGGIIGLAVITRASELIWILPMLFIIWIFNVKKIGFVKFIIFLTFLFLSLTPMFYWNKILYGSFLSTGYAAEVSSPVASEAILNAGVIQKVPVVSASYYQNVFEKFKNAVSLFGFNPKQSLKMLYYYFTNMFPWFFWGAFLGFLNYLWGARKDKRWKRAQSIYFISYFIISLILIFYYGSWEIHDNPDPASFTIGNSYTRYWLPVYLGAMPLLSALILKLTKYTPFSKGGRGDLFFIAFSRIIIVAAIFIISIQFVLAGSEEGLIMSLKKQKQTKYQYNKVLELTGEDDVIITQYHDKLFFPERKVIVGLFDNQERNKRYAKLVNYAPIYYYNFTFPQIDLDYLNNKRLKEAGLGISEIEKITDDFSLYLLQSRE